MTDSENLANDTSAPPLRSDEGELLVTQLDRAKRLLRWVQSSSGLGTWEINLQTGEVYWSDEMYAIYDLPKDTELNRDTCFANVLTEDRTRTDHALANAMNLHTAIEIRHRVLSSESEVKHVKFTGRVESEADCGGTRACGIAQDITLAVLQEQELVESEKRFRSILKASPVPCAVIDAQGHVSFLNPAFTEAFGYAWLDIPSEEVWLVKAFPNPVERGAFMTAWHARMADARANGIPFRPMEARIATKNGASRMVIATASPLGAWSDATHLVTLIDITDRVLAESHARESESRFRAMFEGLGNMVLIADVATRACVDANPAACHMLGYSRDELLTMHVPDFHPPDELPLIIEGFEREARGETRLLPDIPVLRKDGSVFYADVGVARLTIDGRACLAGIFVDLTERRRAQASIWENESKFRAVFEGSPVGSAISRIADGLIVEVNPAFLEISGYARNDLIGKTSIDLNIWVDPEARQRVMSQVSSSNETVEYLGAMRTKTGEQRTVLLYCRAVLIDGVPHVVSMVSDFTERTRTEAARKRHCGQLEETDAVRAAELRQAKEAAEAAKIARNAFLANMSHEFRTPLNAIAGMAHLIRRKGITPQQEEWLAIQETSTNQLAGFVDGLLDLAKLESGKLVLAQQEVDFDSMLRGAVRSAESRLRAKQIQVSVEMAPVPSHLRGDAGRLQQALLNYVDNAVKFTSKGNITLRLSTVVEETDHAILRFEVEDTGIGADPQKLPQLFEPFVQADNTATRQYGGTGLGLAITRKLASLMEGEAGSSSVPGVGSTFWFTARMRKTQPEPAIDQDIPASSPKDILKRDYPGRRILLAEDDPVNRMILIYMLEEAGQKVDFVVDGIEAVARTSDGRYDLILLDIQMPKMTGLEAARRMRALPHCQFVPIIATTANVSDEDRAACFASGMNDFIAKPYTAQDIYSTAVKWLRR